MKRGYVRVSTDEQDLGRQIAALKAEGVEKIYEDKISGAMRSRPGLDDLLRDLERGDILIVQKLDRLGRSLIQLLDIIREIHDRGAQFMSLTEAIDTTSASGRLIYQVMGAIAEFERAMIRERVADGIKHAQANGVKFGRPKADRMATALAIARLEDEGKKREEIMKELGINRNAYYRARGWMEGAGQE